MTRLVGRIEVLNPHHERLGYRGRAIRPGVVHASCRRAHGHFSLSDEQFAKIAPQLPSDDRRVISWAEIVDAIETIAA
jgi:hypothetical protein